MPTARSNVLTRDGSVDPTPFLASSSLYSRSIAQSAAAATLNSPAPGHVDSFRTQGLRQAARFLRRASNSRRMMREPSMVVREAAAQQIEDRQSDWSYSRPVVWLDLAWNMSFVVVAAAVLFFSRDEAPALPLRLWILGYTCQSLAHVFCVFTEYQRRRRPGSGGGVEPGSSAAGTVTASASIRRGGAEEEQSPLTQHLESANTMFSFVWWMIGFYWICVGGQALQLNAPELYWLCVVFLALDVFFVIFCVALASVVAVAVCCCLPCIIAVLYVLADRGGAAREDIEQLPKYKFQKINGEEKNSGEEINDRGEMPVPSEGMMTECCTSSPTRRKLSAEDSECCICLSPYEDGDELRELPCGHHFHCACIDKWLYINSTCPLCKYDILKRSIREEEV